MENGNAKMDMNGEWNGEWWMDKNCGGLLKMAVWYFFFKAKRTAYQQS